MEQGGARGEYSCRVANETTFLMAQTKSALKTFFAPQSVAIVGASEDLTKFGGRLYKTMIDFGAARGSACEIHPVNPGRKTVFGRTSYASVADLPQTPQHVGIVLAAHQVMSALEACAARGVPFATVMSGGFAETGSAEGLRLQNELKAFVKRTGMRIMGPNCNGFANFVDGFVMTNTSAVRGKRNVPGNVAVIGQSGGLAQVNVMWRSLDAGVDVSYQVSCGNEADIDAIEFAQFAVEDEASDVVLIAAESIRSGELFRALAHAAAERAKPLIILKFGKTEAGRKAAASHTGAITGADDVADAAFKQFGVIRVDDCNELYEFAKLLRKRRWPRGKRLAALTGSGGHCVLVADTAASLGLQWAEFAPATGARFEKILPSLVSLANPLDLTSAMTGSPRLFSDSLKVIAEDANVDVLMPILVAPTLGGIDDLVQVNETVGKPVATLWTGYCPEDNAVTVTTLNQRGVPAYRDARMCLRAARAAVDYGEFLRRFERESQTSRNAARDLPADAAAHAAKPLSQPGRVLTERVSKLALAAYGLPVTREVLAHTADEAVQAAAGLVAASGAGVALKIESADIAHKTEAGGVRLNVSGETAVRTAHNEILAAAARHAPNAKIDGVLVQEMTPAGVEMMLGVTRDITFGTVVSVALGGVHVEVLKDIAHGIAPLTHDDARRMVDSLAGRRLLDGVRGAPACDVDAMCDAIVRLSWFALDFADEIAELDINPLMVLPRGQGVRLVDALILKKM